jgi:hypothetical protein
MSYDTNIGGLKLESDLIIYFKFQHSPGIGGTKRGGAKLSQNQVMPYTKYSIPRTTAAKTNVIPVPAFT